MKAIMAGKELSVIVISFFTPHSTNPDSAAHHSSFFPTVMVALHWS